MSLQRRALLRTLAVAVAVGWLASATAADDPKLNATGHWKSTFTTQNGQTIETSYDLKQEGDKLTGTVTGGDGQKVEIKHGTVKDGTASFDVTREFNGQEITIRFRGKVTAAAIQGKVEFERNGEKRSHDWKAVRQKAEK